MYKKLGRISLINDSGKSIQRLQIECDCGEVITCQNFTNTCRNCYADYNMSGDMLAPRDQWGEETGECISDILSADSDYEEDEYDGYYSNRDYDRYSDYY